MKEQIHAIVEELKRLKSDGVSQVTVSDEAMDRLRLAVGASPEAVSGSFSESTVAASGASTPSAMPRSGGSGEAAKEKSPAASEGVKHDAGEVKQLDRLEGDRADLTGEVGAKGFKDLMETAAMAKPSRGGAASSPASKQVSAGATLPTPPVIELPEGSKRERWEWLRERVVNCPVCQEHTHGDCKVVFGVGNIDADIFFCGEAPGGDEEIQGEPFVGRAGQLLTRMIGAMGLSREDVYIGNILNWRPEMEGRRKGTSVRQTGNRPPTEEEMNFCLPYLRAQIEVVQPKVIVALGSTAASGLLGFGSFPSLGAIRGRWHTFNNVPLMVTYHPSYLLRNASNRQKRLVWEDLLLVMERVGLPISEKQRGFFL